MDLKYDLVNKNDPILKQKTEKFDFNNPPIDPVQLVLDLAQTMMYYNGIGLASPQCGLSYRVFLIKSNPIIACFNPIVIDKSEEEIYLEEGCLSFPGLFLKIKRPKTIKVRYTQPNGEIVTKTFDGMTARCFQHKLNHLDGVLFQTHATLYHREQAERKRNRSAK
jgi:peptide deformylase